MVPKIPRQILSPQLSECLDSCLAGFIYVTFMSQNVSRQHVKLTQFELFNINNDNNYSENNNSTITVSMIITITPALNMILNNMSKHLLTTPTKKYVY